MSRTPREIGTLAVVVFKARNLPNKRHIGKQDPYCCVTFSKEKQRTRAIKRGGQHPEWDDEFRFKVYDDEEEDQPAATDGGTPPPPPPKEKKGKKIKNIKGGMTMSVTCYADDPKEPELIGEASVDLTEVLTKGETDEWFTLLHKEKYCGEVYLELTFYSNERPPEKKVPKKLVKPNKQYVGPGTFVPSEDSSSSLGSGAGSRVTSLSKDNIPSSLRASSSIAQLDLYIPPYEKAKQTALPGRRLVSGFDRLTDEFGGLSVQSTGSRRRESFPPPRGHTPQPSSDGGGYSAFQSQHSEGYGSESYSDRTSYYSSYDRATTPTPVATHSNHRHSFGEPQQGQYQSYIPHSQSQPPYDGSSYASSYSPNRSASDYEHNSGPSFPVPTHSSGFSLVSSNSTGYAPSSATTPAPSGFASHLQTPVPTGYAPPITQTPAPASYTPQPAHTPAPSNFAPVPPTSSMGFHQPSNQQPVQQYQYPQQQQYPPPSTPAPPQAYHYSHPPQTFPPSHSAPSQTYQQASYQQTPSPPLPQQYSYQPSTPPPAQVPNALPQAYNPSPPVQGSRPLPVPQQSQGSPYYGLPTPPHAHIQSTPQTIPPTPSPTHVAPAPSSLSQSSLPRPPPPPIFQQQQQPSYNTPTPPRPNGYTIPPPPPLQPNGQSPHRTNPHPLPLRQPQQPFRRDPSPPSRPPLPQPPVHQLQHHQASPHHHQSISYPQPQVQQGQVPAQAPQMGHSVSLPTFQSIPPPPPLPVPPSMSSIANITPSASHPLPTPPQQPAQPLPQPPMQQQQQQAPQQVQYQGLPPPPPLPSQPQPQYQHYMNGDGNSGYPSHPLPGPPPRPPTQVYGSGGW